MNTTPAEVITHALAALETHRAHVAETAQAKMAMADAVLAAHETGVTIRDLAEQMSVPHTTVAFWINEARNRRDNPLPAAAALRSNT
jgi:DNA-directed RNA polymerase specialized sigma24 family protein